MNTDKYAQRGVSANKEDVHSVIKNIDKGLYPNAFCKILPDILAHDEEYCNIMHSDTAGSKTILAYLYWKETGDASVWEGIIQDAIVMNTDDIACAGLVDNYVLSCTILRNKNHITGEVLNILINAQQRFATHMYAAGIKLNFAGGETADVGDIVRTVDVGFTAMARGRRSEIVPMDIREGNVIVGLASYGKSTYEDAYNSGIACNGLTSARHDILNSSYLHTYPETYDPMIKKNLLYAGKYSLMDIEPNTGIAIGKLLLSPTRTYLPVLKKVLSLYRNDIGGIIHCTGGGMTKVLHFVKKVKIIKNNLLLIPPIFQLIKNNTDMSYQELFKVFNMGCRLEFYCQPSIAKSIIDIAHSFHIDAQLIGHVESSPDKGLEINYNNQNYFY